MQGVMEGVRAFEANYPETLRVGLLINGTLQEIFLDHSYMIINNFIDMGLLTFLCSFIFGNYSTLRV